MNSSKLTYENSGVNIKKADKFVKFISSLSKQARNNGGFKNIGGFGAISKIPSKLSLLRASLAFHGSNTQLADPARLPNVSESP